MTKVSTVKDVVLKSKLYSSKSRTSLLVTVALAVTPLIIDGLMTDDSYQCPQKRGILISSILLFGPTICITLLGVSHSIKYIREHDNRSFSNMAKRLLARLFGIGITMCITIGSSFILSEHYVCLVQLKYPNGIYMNETANMSKPFLINQSRQIGWTVIMGTLLVTFIVALIQLVFYRPSFMQKAIRYFISCQRKEARKQLDEALNRLSKRIIEQNLEKNSINSNSEESDICQIIAAFKKEKRQILNSKKNFKPANMNLREKLHFFSLSFDDRLDETASFL